MDSATLAGLITTVLTEFASRVAGALGRALPPFAKQLLAAIVATGINVAGLVPPIHIAGLPPTVDTALSAAVAWFIAMVIHDVASSVQPPKPS